MHWTHPSAVLKCQQKLRSCSEGRGAGCPLLNSLSFPSSLCLTSQTSSLLPPSLLGRRPGRTNTGYSTPRQELPGSESTREPPDAAGNPSAGWALPRPRDCGAAPPGALPGVFQRDRSATDPRCLMECTALGCIYPYCLKCFTSRLKKPFYTFSLRVLGKNLFIALP